jgi:transposase
LWNNRRRSILTSRQHLVGEAESLLCELPLELSEQLPDTKAVKPRLAALARRNRRRRYDAPTKLRLQLLDGYRTQIKALDLEEKQVVAQLEELVDRSGSTLGELSALSTRSVVELLVEVGDPRRFTEGRVRAL